MVIPSDASVNVQSAFRDLDRRLQDLERAGNGAALSSSTDVVAFSAQLASIRKDLISVGEDSRRLFTVGPRLPPFPQISGNKAVGLNWPSGTEGLAQDTGTGAVTQGGVNYLDDRVLTLSGRWQTVMDGLLQRTTSDLLGQGLTTADYHTLMGNLAMVGALSCGDLFVQGELDVRFPRCRAYRDTTQSINDATWTAISLNAEHWDSHAFFAATSKRITIPTGLGGFYVARGAVGFATNATGNRAIGIAVDDDADATTGLIEDALAVAPSANTSVQEVTAFADMKDGQFFTLKCWQNSGGSLNAIAVGTLGRTFGLSLDVLRLGR